MMIEPADTIERDGVTVEIVPDDEPLSSPQENDNAGTIYSWSRDWEGDESIRQPDTISGRPYDLADAIYEVKGEDAARILVDYFSEYWDAALTIPLRFSDYGSSGARIYEADAEDANCAICFTQEEIDKEWSGSVENARSYALARVGELDDFFQGSVYGLVAKGPDGEVMESVWGFIGDLWGKSGEYIRQEAEGMAIECARAVERERAEAAEWAARDVVTI